MFTKTIQKSLVFSVDEIKEVAVSLLENKCKKDLDCLKNSLLLELQKLLDVHDADSFIIFLDLDWAIDLSPVDLTNIILKRLKQ